MKRSLPLLLVFCLLVLGSACTLTPPNQTPESPTQPVIAEENRQEHNLFPYLGIWFSEDRSSQLIFTDAYVYFHDFPSQREVYAQVVESNLVENILDLRLQYIIYSGEYMGFDSPMISVQYQISPESMQVWLGRLVVSGGDQPVVYLYDEALNP